MPQKLNKVWRFEYKQPKNFTFKNQALNQVRIPERVSRGEAHVV